MWGAFVLLTIASPRLGLPRRLGKLAGEKHVYSARAAWRCLEALQIGSVSVGGAATIFTCRRRNQTRAGARARAIRHRPVVDQDLGGIGGTDNLEDVAQPESVARPETGANRRLAPNPVLSKFGPSRGPARARDRSRAPERREHQRDRKGPRLRTEERFVQIGIDRCDSRPQSAVSSSHMAKSFQRTGFRWIGATG